MTVRFAQWTVDVQDTERMAAFWAAALGYDDVRRGEDGSAKLYPPSDAPPEVATLWLQNTGAAKQGKNRFHPDLRPADGDVDKAVARLLELGARHADVGQTGGEAFVVLADPEGNEFCVLKKEPRYN
jgi:catechol 2,3-dioxygenase-like lactoylglutathione lyase family enzyme